MCDKKAKDEKEISTIAVGEQTPSEEPKKKSSKVKKTIEWVLTGIFGVLIVVLATFNIARWTNKDGYVFNYMFPQVLSESMEPTYKVGEVIVVKKVDPKEIKVGDDVTFYYYFPDVSTEEVKCTHRVIDLTYDATLKEGEQYTFTCQGINKDSPRWSSATQVFHENKLLGKVVGKSKFMEGLYKVLSSVWSLVILVLIPSLYLIISAVLDLFKKLPDDDKKEIKAIEASGKEAPIDTSKEENVNRLEGMSEKDKERLKKQLLEEMLKSRKEGKK